MKSETLGVKEREMSEVHDSVEPRLVADSAILKRMRTLFEQYEIISKLLRFETKWHACILHCVMRRIYVECPVPGDQTFAYIYVLPLKIVNETHGYMAICSLEEATCFLLSRDCAIFAGAVDEHGHWQQSQKVLLHGRKVVVYSKSAPRLRESFRPHFVQLWMDRVIGDRPEE